MVGAWPESPLSLPRGIRTMSSRAYGPAPGAGQARPTGKEVEIVTGSPDNDEMEVLRGSAESARRNGRRCGGARPGVGRGGGLGRGRGPACRRPGAGSHGKSARRRRSRTETLVTGRTPGTSHPQPATGHHGAPAKATPTTARAAARDTRRATRQAGRMGLRLPEMARRIGRYGGGGDGSQGALHFALTAGASFL